MLEAHLINSNCFSLFCFCIIQTKSESLDVGKMLLKESSEETTLFSLLHLASVARIGWSCQKTSDNELPKGCDASALSFDSKGKHLHDYIRRYFLD